MTVHAPLKPLRELFAPDQPRPVVIFDVDGTLLDKRQEDIYGNLIVRALARQLGQPREKAQALMTEVYHATGNIAGLTRLVPGYTHDHLLAMYTEASLRYRRTLPWHFTSHDGIIFELEKLAQATTALGILTANKLDHVVEVLAFAKFDRHLHPHLTMGSDCAGAHKGHENGYDEINRRIDALFGPDIPRVMVEDSAPNLPAAKRAGFITIHLGEKPVTPQAAPAIDYRFPAGILPALVEMNGGR
jgi:phosphoglycolate phosphatase-like HAD superfamily hydrolase